MPIVDCAGAKLFYEETGTGDAIVWIHEFCADYRTWEQQVRRFSRDYRCVTYNARGYPPSFVPEDPAAYGYEHQRDDLIRLMDALGIEKAHLVGLSMGAYTGIQVALAHPDRVLSLVFSSGGAQISSELPSDATAACQDSRDDFMHQIDVAAERIRQEGMDATARVAALGATRVQLQDKDVRGWLEFRTQMSEHSPLGTALTLAHFQARRPPLSDFEQQLRELDVPVLLAVGDEDDPVIEVNLFLKRTLPRAGLWMQPKTGHGINLEEPGEYNRRVADFISSVERGAWHRRDPRSVNTSAQQ